MQLNCFPPKVTRTESQALFKGRMREFRHGKFMFETGFYVPFYLFKVEVKNGKTQTSNFLSLDAVTGNLDLYSFEQELQDADFLLIESAQFPPTLLSEESAVSLLEEKVRRSVYAKGFFKISDLKITCTVIRQFYLPYWIGFYERKKQVNIEVLDAVRGQFEGTKLRELVMNWFQAEAATK